jgi:predicted  nucleic acid-binding Zn-ribbon protein
MTSSENLTELQDYLLRVLEELHKREQALYRIDNTIASLERKLGTLSSQRGVLRGDATAVVATEMFRNRVRRELVACTSERRIAQEEVQRARDRKTAIEQELAEALASVDTEGAS